MKVRELFVRVGVKVDDDDLDNVDERLNDVKDSVGDLVGWLGKLAAGFTAVAGAAGMITARTAEYSEEIVRNADALGMSTDKYQELKFAFDALGASTDDMMDAMSTLTDRAKDAEEGTAEYVKEFQRLGISIDEIRGKQPGEIFDIYVEAAQNAEDRTQAVTSAVRLFGDDLGRRIMPALTTAAEDFDVWRQVARDTGIVMEEEFVRKARVVRQEWRALGGRVEALGFTLGESLMPLFNLFLTRLNDLIDRFMRSGQAIEWFEVFATKLGRDLEKLWFWFTQIGEALGFEGALQALHGVWAAVKTIIALITGAKLVSVVSAVAGFFSAMSTSAAIVAAQTVLSAAAAAVMALAAEDFLVHMTEGESTTGDLIENFGEGDSLLDSMARTAGETEESWSSIKVFASGLGRLLKNVIISAVVSLLGFFAELGSLIVDTIYLIIQAGRRIGDIIEAMAAGQWKRAFSEMGMFLFEVLVNALNAAMRFGMGLVDRFFQFLSTQFREWVDPIIRIMARMDGEDPEKASKEWRKTINAKASGFRGALKDRLKLGTDTLNDAKKQLARAMSKGENFHISARVPTEKTAGPQGGFSAVPGAASSVAAGPPQGGASPAPAGDSVHIENLNVNGDMSAPRQKRATEKTLKSTLRQARQSARKGDR